MTGRLDNDDAGLENQKDAEKKSLWKKTFGKGRVWKKYIRSTQLSMK